MTTSNQPSTFSSLPQEICDEIWLQTLTPRFLYIHQHREYSPPLRRTSPKLELEVGEVTITSIRFNHTLYSSFITPGAAFKAYADTSARNRESPSASSPHSRSDAPPPALLVCRESRNLAIKKGYVLAFNVVFPWQQNTTKNPSADLTDPPSKDLNTSSLGSKGIGISFSSDMLMFDLVNRPGVYPRFSEPGDISPFPLLAQHHPSDLAQIRHSALGGSLASIVDPLTEETVSPSGGGSMGWWEKLSMRGLRACWADDEFEVEGSDKGRDAYYRWAGDSGMAGVRSYKLSEKADALQRLVESVEVTAGVRTGRRRVVLAGPKPELRIVRGEEWPA